MKKLLRDICVSMALTACAAYGQTPASGLAFEVASIKLAPPINPAMIMSGQMHIGMKVDGDRVDIGSLSLADLIRIAYNVKPYQVTGPDWMGAQRFDVMAKLPEGATKEQVPEMLQALLAERFKLTIHRETKEHGVYALVVAKGGSKLKESPPDVEPAVPAAPGAATGMSISGNIQGKGIVVSGAPGQTGAMRMTMGEGGTMRMESSKMTVAALTDLLSPMIDRPVVDMTELKGHYEVALELSMDTMRAMAAKSGMMPMGAGQQAAMSAGDPRTPRPIHRAAPFQSVQQLGSGWNHARLRSNSL